MNNYVRLAAAMRELAERYTHGQRTSESDRQVVLFNSAARACDTLVATLTCLRAEEAAHAQTTRERDEALARLDRADCTHREGGDTRHCRHDRLCWHCRHDEAVALLREALSYVTDIDRMGTTPESQDLLARLDVFLVGRKS